MSKHPSPSGRLRGQTVLVTGTTKGGIGYETARLLGDEGATVLTHARTPEAAGASVENLVVDGNGAGRFIPVAADLSSIAGARAASRRRPSRSPPGHPRSGQQRRRRVHRAAAVPRWHRDDHGHQPRRGSRPDRRTPRPAARGCGLLGKTVAGSQHDRVDRGARESRNRLVLSGQVHPDSGLLQRQVGQPALHLCPGAPTRRARGHRQRGQPRHREIGFRRQGRRNLRADGTVRRTAIRPPQSRLPRGACGSWPTQTWPRPPAATTRPPNTRNPPRSPAQSTCRSRSTCRPNAPCVPTATTTPGASVMTAFAARRSVSSS